jgi:pimeloyl-ACP methyl ester carboxylesterase
MTTTSRRHAMTASLGLALVGASLPHSTLVHAEQTAEGPDTAATRTHYKSVQIDGLKVFYREAGSPAVPALLLLHGFPTSSHMFRNLIPALADRYRVVAPDYPGFGYSDFPDRQQFHYGFASYAEIIDKFTQAIGLSRYALYIQDYGAPVGLRLALRAPERVTGLIVQNGNAYEEGLSAAWSPIKDYWREPTPANREKLRGWLTLDGTRSQYTTGLSDAQAELVSPDTWMLDWSLLSRPGNIDLQLDLFGDYRTNVALYPDFQAFFRKHRPPTLIVWGRSDPFFTVAGAQAYQRDLPKAELHLLDAGHFALETNGAEIAANIRRFLPAQPA